MTALADSNAYALVKACVGDDTTGELVIAVDVDFFNQTGEEMRIDPESSVKVVTNVISFITNRKVSTTSTNPNNPMNASQWLPGKFQQVRFNKFWIFFRMNC